MNKTLLSIIAVAIVVGGGAFYGGMKYTESKNPGRRLSQADFSARVGSNAGGFRNRTGGQQEGGLVGGEIIAKDDKSVTIKFRDGGSKIVFLSDSTEITKSASGSIDDLEVGKTIGVNGTVNLDGSVTAESIQLRPQQF